MEELWVYEHRKHLVRTKKAIEDGFLTIGFIGGSITGGEHNWPEPVINWFVEQFPDTQINVENCGIGATGSDLAVFRAQQHLVERNCDLIFVEFAVNDFYTPRETRWQAREGLLRQLLNPKQHDVILTYAFNQGMYNDMFEGRIPESIADFEVLASHYHLGSVWMGLHAFEEVKKGRMRWEEWLPDGLHPTARGSLSYGQSVILFLEKELMTESNTGSISERDVLPEPVNANHWGNARILPFSMVQRNGPWTVRRSSNSPWMTKILQTAAVGAKLEFSFEGRGVALCSVFGAGSAEYRYQIDDQPIVTTRRERPSWCGFDGWYRVDLLADDLPFDWHHVRLEVVHGDREECQGTNFRLSMIGVI